MEHKHMKTLGEKKKVYGFSYTPNELSIYFLKPIKKSIIP